MKKEVGGRRAKDRATWVFALFIVLFLVNLAPLVILGAIGGWSREAWKDPSYHAPFLLVCAAPIVALAGAVGSRRRWHAIVLSFLGLLTIAWPLLVTWVLLNVMVAV